MIDLHVHTQASDGTWGPGEAIAKAARIGLHAVALTDHDSLASVEAGAMAAIEAGICFVTGVEITAGSNDVEVLHVLGYGVDGKNRAFADVLSFNQRAWEENERQSLANLAGLGIRIDSSRYDYWVRHREAGGWPTYNCLVELGVVRDYREYFERYFGRGRPAYVTTSFVRPEQAVVAVRNAGGVPVLAHPGAYDPGGRTILDRPGFLDSMVEMGIEGFEVFANENNPAVTRLLMTYCQNHDLLITGGSDCHGDFAGRTLGQPPVPDEYLPPLLARLKKGA